MKYGWTAWMLLFVLCPVRGEDRSPISISIAGGTAGAQGPSAFARDHRMGNHFDLRVGYQATDKWLVGAQAGRWRINADTSTARDVTFVPIMFWAQRDFPWTRLWTPYLSLGAGLSRNTFSTSASTAKTGWVATVGAGLTFVYSELQEISLEAQARRVARATELGGVATLWSAGLVMRFYLPETWVPMNPPVEITQADLEIPLVASPEESWEIDPSILAQADIASMQEDIEQGKLPPIIFDPGTAILQTTSFEALDTLGTILRKYPDVQLRVYGYVEANYQGPNRESLAVARSQVVGTYVIRHFYLNESRLQYLAEPVPPADKPGIEFEVIARH